jgi:hypothetical protein
LGRVIDWLSVFGAVPWVVVMILFAVHLAAGAAMWVFTIVTYLGVATLATVTLLMIFAELRAQAFVAVPLTVLAFAWIAVAAAAMRSAAAVPPWVSVLAIVFFVALLVGAAAAGIGYFVTAGSPVQAAFYVTGAVVGGLAWFAFPTCGSPWRRRCGERPEFGLRRPVCCLL